MKKSMAGLLSALLSVFLMAGCSSAKAPDADWRIIVASDLHYLAPELTDHGELFQRVMEAGDGKMTEYCDPIVDAFLSEVIETRPEVLILTGDLSFNGARKSHEALAEKLACVEEAGIPVLVLTGNHDVYRSEAYSYIGDTGEAVETVTDEGFRDIYAAFGFDEALSEDEDSLSYTATLNDSARVLMLDANTLHDFCGFSDKTFDWIETQLAEAREAGVQVLAACHQNLYRHSMFGAGYVLEGNDRLHELLKQYDVSLILSGHMHIQHILSAEGVTEIASSALTMGECRYGLLESRDGVFRYETRPVDVNAWADRAGRSEEVPEAFTSFALGSLERRTREQAERQLAARGFDEEKIQTMTDYACALNNAYFTGDLSAIPTLDPDGSLLGAWKDSGTFFGFYFASIEEEIGKDHTQWTGS